MKRLIVVLILGLASLFIAPDPAVAQSPETTASEVVDAETLKAFVEGAKARIEEISESKQLLTPFIASLTEEGDWKHGDTYLILLNEEGVVLFHSDAADAGDKDL